MQPQQLQQPHLQQQPQLPFVPPPGEFSRFDFQKGNVASVADEHYFFLFFFGSVSKLGCGPGSASVLDPH
jgi:hypothetical protein